MKKIIFVSLCMLFFFGFNLINVRAFNQTTYPIDSGNKIVFSSDLLVGETNGFTLSGFTTNAVISFQQQDVSNVSTTVAKIDEIYQVLKQLHAAEKERASLATGTEEANNKDAIIITYKSTINEMVYSDNNLKTAIDDPTGSAWTTLTSQVIPTTNMIENNYYIVWLKVVDGSTTTYKYYPYKYVSSSYYTSDTSTVDNPDTGIETTLLYLAVGTAIIIGSTLVIKKNKESYE